MGELFGSIAIMFVVIGTFSCVGSRIRGDVEEYDKYYKSLDACIIKHKELPAPDVVCEAMIKKRDF